MKRLIHALWIGVLVICLLGLLSSAQAKPFAYIPCGMDRQVSVIDTATNTVVDTVPIEQYHLFGVAVHPHGTYVYVTGDDGVAVIDTAINTVVDTLPAESSSAVAIHPNGAYVYAACSAGVSVIETATNTVIDTVPVGGSVFCLAIHPNGAYVYGTTNGAVLMINTVTNRVVDALPVGKEYATGVAVGPDGKFLYVACCDDVSGGFVAVINAATNTVVATVPVGNIAIGVAVHPNGEYVYVTGSDTIDDIGDVAGVVSVIETATNTVVDTVPVGSDPGGGVDVHPDGTYVYAAMSHGVSVIQTATNTMVEYVPLGNWSNIIAMGRFIAPSRNTGFPDDTMAPTGAVHAHDNAILPNDKNVSVTLDGYVSDELSIARDSKGIGVSSAYLMVGSTKIILDGMLGNDGSFSVTTEVEAVEGAVHDVKLYATDTEPEASGGPNSGLVDLTYIVVTAPPKPTSISVGSIVYSTEGGKNQDRDLLVTVALKDDLGNPVANTSVSIDLKRNEKIVASEADITGTDGTVTYTYRNAPSGTYSTVVTAVYATGLTWDGLTPANSINK